VKIVSDRYPQENPDILSRTIAGKPLVSPLGEVDGTVAVMGFSDVIQISETMTQGRPLIDRIVMIAGEGVSNPGWYRVRIGTPFADIKNELLKHDDSAWRIIRGDIFTGEGFAEMSGSAVADVAALGSILIPAMKKRGYPGPFAAAVTSSSATIAVIIPPSIPMILYAVMADSSVVKLFVAGIIPGIMGGLLMMVLSYWFAVRRNYPVEEVFEWRKLWRTFKAASWAFLLPFIILGGIFGGFVTATEGAGLAVIVSLILGGVVYRELNWPHLKDAIIEGGISTAVVMLLVAASALVGTYLTELQVPQKLAQQIMAFTQNPYAVLALLNIFFLIVGCFLHSAAAIILVVPIVMPLINAVGIDPVHFGLVVTLNLGIGQQTPPVASVLITACSVAKADIWEVS